MQLTQKQAVKQILDGFRHEMVKYAFVSEWLQDINWHTENRMWYERQMPKLYEEQEIKAMKLYLLQREDCYKKDHWDHIVETYKITEQDREDLERIKNGDSIMLWESNTVVDLDLVNDYARMMGAYSTLNHIYGWGINMDKVGGWKHDSGHNLLDEIELLIRAKN